MLDVDAGFGVPGPVRRTVTAVGRVWFRVRVTLTLTP